jgi:PAS domain S-box-containing protein
MDPPFAGLDTAMREAADQAGVGIAVAVHGPDGAFNAFVNQAALEILGRPREEVMRQPILNFIAPEDLPRITEIFRRRREGDLTPSRVQLMLHRPDGTRVPIVTSNGHVVIDGRPTTISFFWDVSKQQAEAERLARVVASSPDAIALVQGPIFRNVNAAGARLLGFEDPKELIGKSLEDMIVPEDQAVMRERMGATMGGRPQSLQTYRVRRRDGSIVHAEVSSIRFEHEGQPAMLAFVRDVTGRAHLMDQLARAERLAALSTLAAGLAHEINNPLTAATLQLDVVEKIALDAVSDPATKAELTERFEELRRTQSRIGAIMRDFEEFSHSGEEHRTKVDLTQVLRSVERMLAPMLRHKGRFRNEVGALPKVHADASRLEQVFMNLLLNAVQALPEGRSGNEVRVLGRITPDSRVCIEVRDNGQGIAKENQRRIFDPFFTTKPVGVGTGLGLTVCHNIIAAYGGDIQVESTLDAGTTMRVLLPPAEGERVVPPQARGRPRVLIVDDEPHLATTLRLLLEDRHDVVATTHGEQAVHLLLEGAVVDVVLCDLMMPSPDGVEVFRRVTEARPELKERFIFMTGGVFNPATEDFLKASQAARVQKPFHAEHVEALIARVAAGT